MLSTHSLWYYTIGQFKKLNIYRNGIYMCYGDDSLLWANMNHEFGTVVYPRIIWYELENGYIINYWDRYSISFKEAKTTNITVIKQYIQNKQNKDK